MADPEIVGEGDDLINKSCSRPTGPKFETRRADSRGLGLWEGAASSLTTSYTAVSAVSSPVGSEAEPQPKSNLMHFSLKI